MGEREPIGGNGSPSGDVTGKLHPRRGRSMAKDHAAGGRTPLRCEVPMSTRHSLSTGLADLLLVLLGVALAHALIPAP